MKKLLHLPLILFAGIVSAESDNLNYTIQGKSGDEVELETLSPNPDIPSADSILFSLDGGKSAREDEVVPLSAYSAALMSDPTKIEAPVLPLIPEAPFIVHPLPLGDKWDVKRNRDVFGPGREEAFLHYNWEFKVVNENNQTLFSKTGKGKPENPILWDGFSEDSFVLNPNHAINSFLVVTSSNEIVGTWTGEAVRFLATRHWEGDDFVLTFSERLYDKDSHLFSKPGKIFLNDFASRLFYHIHRSTTIAEKGDWSITLLEPKKNTKGYLSESRLRIWKKFLKEKMGDAKLKENITVSPTDDLVSQTRIILKNYKAPKDPNMRGRPALPRPQLEPNKDWVQTKERKDSVLISLRHDRLFLPGSAYLRDEALPGLASALELVGEESDVQIKENPREELSEKELKKLNKKMKRKNHQQPGGRVIVLESYTEKIHDKKRNKIEEDPELDALRTKVLFSLFAKERFLPR